MYGGKFAFQNRLGQPYSKLEGNLPFLLCFTLVQGSFGDFVGSPRDFFGFCFLPPI